MWFPFSCKCSIVKYIISLKLNTKYNFRSSSKHSNLFSFFINFRVFIFKILSSLNIIETSFKSGIQISPSFHIFCKLLSKTFQVILTFQFQCLCHSYKTSLNFQILNNKFSFVFHPSFIFFIIYEENKNVNTFLKTFFKKVYNYIMFTFTCIILYLCVIIKLAKLQVQFVCSFCRVTNVKNVPAKFYRGRLQRNF